MITFRLVDGTGKEMTVTVPVPSKWYLRWSLRFAAWIWIKVAEAQA